MKPGTTATVAQAATDAIRYNAPVDGFGQSKRLDDYAALWGNAVANRLVADGLISDGTIDRAVAEAIVATAKDHAVDGQVRVAELIHIANSVVGWSSADGMQHLKAEALREAAAFQREIARNSRTRDGSAEAENIADWLDERANLIDPSRLEGAHP